MIPPTPAARLGLLFLTAVLALPALGAADSTLGPAPRSEDGRFVNEGGPLARAGVSVTFPFFMRRIAGAFWTRPGAPKSIDLDLEFLHENASHSVPTVTWIGHATLLVQMGSLTFLTDPIWSDTASPFSFAGPRRFVAPPVQIEDLPPIDFVIISHNHYDHLDLASLRALAKRDPATRFYVPLGNGELLRSQRIEPVHEFDWGDQLVHGKVTVHCLPAQHWSQRGVTDFKKALWSSWAVVGPERRFYFGGDTGYFKGFDRIGQSLGPFDLAALPIGAYEPQAMMKNWHLDPEQAIQAALDLRARRALGMHFGTFDLTDEPLDEPPHRFRNAAEEVSDRLDEAWVLKVGETREF